MLKTFVKHRDARRPTSGDCEVRRVTIQHFKGRMPCSQVKPTVYHEFRCREKVHPIILSLANEHAKVDFDFLIFTFYLSISLRMICCGDTRLNPEPLIEGAHTSSCKLGSPITYDFLRDPMQREDLFEVDGSYSISRDLRSYWK